ncbi:peptide-methionine (S)-S-oxide reductase MsrA [Corynebacterium sp. TAE3-ERU12]|uniref:peptide-methionine (S)-S-oxide reductase MsrA n=1 Tax=Corynebacterium sp. TAE3-ERU12 TaxID=2849491 RepID=UPI001C4412AD|nr:peptide-methionine (S)-S-oxide reductase MsrA [Corynebacterium sp. TAE3-ERU12]MBV7296094.1 peptide-methionine (S)-S-oxide reductase MsrA [Corynebacterium sp. TAE3-ERU12]
MGWNFTNTPQMVTADTALRGGSAPVLPEPAPHTVLGTPIAEPWKDDQNRVWLGMGCFWGAEKLMWNLPGVESTAVGYAGGFSPNPTYREVCTGRTGHTEIVQVIFNTNTTTLTDVLKAALEAHDPTQGYRQGNDVGTQYRSAIYTTDEHDAALARHVAEAYAERLADAGYDQLTTEIKPLADTPAGEFYLAEDYHQQYLQKNPGGYCPHHGTGVACEINWN